LFTHKKTVNRATEYSSQPNKKEATQFLPFLESGEKIK